MGLTEYQRRSGGSASLPSRRAKEKRAGREEAAAKETALSAT